LRLQADLFLFMALSVSAKGRQFITEHEGEVLYVYLDPIGLPTVGVGHLVEPEERSQYPVGRKITKAHSQELLSRDLRKFEAGVRAAVRWPVNQNQFDALVSLAFNIGLANFKKSSVVRHLNVPDKEKAANAFLAWNKARKDGKLVVLPGLVRRRKEERALFLSSSPAPQAPATESATKPPVIILPVTEDKQDSAGDLSILDRVSSPFIAVKQKFDVLGVDPTKISKSSAVTTIGLKAWGAILMAVSFFYDNPIYLGAATALIVVGAVVFIFAKRNATARTTNVQTTVNVEAK
jgi:lysozyme